MKEDQPQLFFDECYHHFLSSTEKGEYKSYYRLAGFVICLHFASIDLVNRLGPALEHLRIEASESVDFTICIWNDSPISWPYVSRAMRGEVTGYNTDRFYTVADIHTQVLHLFDKERNLALYRIQTKLPWWIGGSPFQLLFHWWLQTKGFQLTHAAAVGYPQGAVLMAGKSGSGKSTTSLSCMKAGMQYLGEDYCLVGNKSPLQVHSIYNSAKIEERTLQWFPELKAHVANTWRSEKEKAFFYHHTFQPQKILLSSPLKAILSLQIEPDQESWLEPIASHEVLAPLTASTLWQLTHTGPPVFHHLKKVAESLPCYRLHLGADLTQAPKWIEKIL